MQVETWTIEKLTAYSRTIRKNDHVVERMAASIREFGFKIPILARSSGEVVDGHLRLKAAQFLRMIEVPVILCDEWTAAQVKAFRLLVNQSANWAEWDLEALSKELLELKTVSFDLTLTGFDSKELDRYLFRSQDENDEPVDRPQPLQVSQSSDLWLCGKHRVLCGDATSTADVDALLGLARPVLMVTDPPYGVAYDPMWREQAGLGRQRQTGEVQNDDRVDWSAAYRLFPGDIAYVWHAGIHAVEVAQSLEAAGFSIRAQIIWAKQHFALSRGDYHWQHEPCWYAIRKGKSSSWCGERNQSTLWEIPNLNPFGGAAEDATGHGTQKPLELMRRPILNNSRPGAIVYDPFLGSGTTLTAADATGRICYGMDVDPTYVDVIIRRWQSAAGGVARLASTNETFTEVQSRRQTQTEVA